MGMARVARFPVPVHEPTHETGKSYVRPLALAVVNNVVALCDAAAVAARNISLRGCLLSAQSGQSSFSEAAIHPNPNFSNWPAAKRPLADSHCRPGAAARRGNPISIGRASRTPGERPVFGEQIFDCTASTRPQSSIVVPNPKQSG